MPLIANFVGWDVPAGFETFEVVQTLDGPLLNGAGEVAASGPAEYHYGVGHRTQLPDGSWLIVRPGNSDHYAAPGYFLAAYSAAGAWLWGHQFEVVEAALAAAGTELRIAQQQARR